MKLPVSNGSALALPFAQPTGYGLGKSGWVTASFPDPREIPIDLLKEWIDESYRSIAPKRVLATLESAEKFGKATAQQKARKKG